MCVFNHYFIIQYTMIYTLFILSGIACMMLLAIGAICIGAIMFNSKCSSKGEKIFGLGVTMVGACAAFFGVFLLDPVLFMGFFS